MKNKHTFTMKLERFDIEDNSWSHDMKENIQGLLKTIPVDDLEIDVPKVIYNGLVHFVGNLECEFIWQFGDYWSVAYCYQIYILNDSLFCVSLTNNPLDICLVYMITQKNKVLFVSNQIHFVESLRNM